MTDDSSVKRNRPWRKWLDWSARGILLLMLLALAVLACSLTGPWHNAIVRRQACADVVHVEDPLRWTPTVVLNLPYLCFASFHPADSAQRYLAVRRWWGGERYVDGFREKFPVGATIAHYRRVGGYRDLIVTATGTVTGDDDEPKPWAEVEFTRNRQRGKGLLACFGDERRRYLAACTATPEEYDRQAALEFVMQLHHAQP